MKSRIQAVGVLTSILVLCILQRSGEAQNLRELAREHAAREPGVALHLTAPPGDYREKEIQALARESSVVLRGMLVRSRVYLGRREDRVHTDYDIHVQQLIAGNLPLMTAKLSGSTPPLTLTVFGGELMVEGVLVRAIDSNRDEIVAGKSYLLFLRPSRSGGPGSYEIYYGGIFDVSDGKVRPLLRRGEEVFKSAAGSAFEDLVRKIKMAQE